MIEACICPKCSNFLLYIQSKLSNEINTAQIKYTIECYWCDFEFGDYDSKRELLDTFKNKYGGK